MIGIYKIESPSGKVYIGQTWNSSKRFSNYKSLSCKCQTKLYNSLCKYGFDNHIVEIIHEFPEDVSQETMNNYEKFYVEQYKNCNVELMNLREPGSKGRHSSKIRTQIAESLREYFRQNGTLNNKPIIQYDLQYKIVKKWKSAREASIELKINYKNISAVATCKNGRYKTYKGYIWKFDN